jgi:GR25 family glycosyltransferase involved in LPS biosynthesis
MLQFFNSFDAVYVINLDHRGDRLNRFVDGLKKIGMTKEEIESVVRRWPATSTPENGALGCILSHLAIVKEAKSKGYKKILVFEDDAVAFSTNRTDYLKASIDIREEEWDVYYLGYNSHEKLDLAAPSSLLAKEIFSTHAIAYNHTFFDHFIRSYENGEISILDVWFRYQVQPKMRCLAAYPLLFTQMSGYSDIEKKDVSYDFIVKRYEENTSHLQKTPAISVCIPTYEMKGRGAEFLSYSFQRLNQQTFKDFEIVVSDHSNDESISRVCEKWENKLSIRYLKDPNRGNSSANVNNAIKNAKGHIVKILFQDDFLCEESALQKIFEVHYQGSIWCATGCLHTTDGITMERPFIPRYHENIHLGENTMSSPSVISFIRNRGTWFDENLVWLMDCDFYRSMRDKNGMPSVLKEHLVVNRLWGDNYTNLIEDSRKDSEYEYTKNKYGEY